MRLSHDDLQRWRSEGYVIVENFLTRAEIDSCRAELMRVFPTPQQYAMAPRLFDNYEPGGAAFDPPFLGHPLKMMAAHPALIDFVERALGTRDIILTRAKAWAKYAGFNDFEQPLHADYMVDSLLYPAADDEPEQVTAILYYVDMDGDLGPTYVVPRNDSLDLPLVPYSRSRHEDAALYAREQAVIVPAGSLLLYQLGTIHRGSRLTRPDAVRLTHHFAYRRADAHWAGCTFWGDYGLTAEMQELIEQATPRQRELFGVPPPGHRYWNEQTTIGMALRYSAMDMTPYLPVGRVDEARVREARAGLERSLSPGRATRSTGVVSAWGSFRDQLMVSCSRSPRAAAYWAGFCDYYENVAVERQAENARNYRQRPAVEEPG
jgi:Phytanoyl-CoA dioxygenase (PhyH)